MRAYQLVLILFLVTIIMPNFSNSFAVVYMHIPGIEGESKDTGHEGWIDLLSIQYMTESNESEQILVIKNLDKSSPKITQAISSGLVIKEVRIDLCDSKSCYEKIVLGNVYLTEYSFSASSGSGNGIVEEINLLFESSQLFKEGKTTTSSDEPTKTKGIEEQISQKIPDWVKNNAGWWAEGTIGEKDFVGGIQFLINENIIDIPDLPEQASDTSQEKVPDWIKNNAGWWAKGLISEDDFVNGIKYLVEKGIIVV